MSNQLSTGFSLGTGSLDLVQGNLLHGWFYGSDRDCRPFVMVNGSKATLIQENIRRPDVCAALGIAESEAPGFIFQLPAASAGSRIELYAAGRNNCALVASKPLEVDVGESSLIAQVDKAAQIARQPNSIGIVCWDGAHNPLGRAFELYQIAATRHPVVVLCYFNEEYGHKLWHPLLNWDGNIVTIPWTRRQLGEDLLNKYGVSFETIWICKPRLPSFFLAGAIAKADTRYVLDIDDNEEAFIRPPEYFNAYEYQGANLARHLADRIQARTVSGPALQSRFGGHIVRHVRTAAPTLAVNEDDKIHIGFIGTVRPHKNVVGLARSIKLLSLATGLPLVLDIYGDILPAELEGELRAAGAELYGPLGFSELPRVMGRIQVMVTGFPSASVFPETQQISGYQVAAKISDALAAGKPVLVPHTEAVADLASIPGVRLFTENNFAEQMIEALKDKTPVSLPEDFTPEGAYKTFALARSEANINIQLPRLTYPYTCETKPSVVLIWKQCDAGIYGRRPDQIARSLVKALPDFKILILEISDNFDAAPSAQADFSHSDDFSSDLPLQREWLLRKRTGALRDGVRYQAFSGSSNAILQEELETYLIENNILPENSLFIVFPFIKKLEAIENILRPYPMLADIVDNNLSWAKENGLPERIMEQYFSLMASAKYTIFNSTANRDFFAERGFIQNERVRVIPNWYYLPPGIKLKRAPIQDGKKHIFYSGNLNDRIDWGILNLAAALPGVQLHIAGNAAQRKNELAALLACGAIYHGVLKEHQTLECLCQMDACIIPHKLDKFSFYMNPIKLQMYRAVGMRTVLPAWLASAPCEDTYENSDEFAQIIANLPKCTKWERDSGRPSDSWTAYLDLIRASHPTLAAR